MDLRDAGRSVFGGARLAASLSPCVQALDEMAVGAAHIQEGATVVDGFGDHLAGMAEPYRIAAVCGLRPWVLPRKGRQMCDRPGEVERLLLSDLIGLELHLERCATFVESRIVAELSDAISFRTRRVDRLHVASSRMAPHHHGRAPVKPAPVVAARHQAVSPFRHSLLRMAYTRLSTHSSPRRRCSRLCASFVMPHFCMTRSEATFPASQEAHSL
jgi:hypothetical protein